MIQFGATSALPDLVATELAWNDAQAGVDLGYEVAGADLTEDTTVALYWASGTTFDTVLGGPVYDTPIEHLVGQYGPFYVPNAVLGTPPPGATHLLLVVDPNNTVVEPDGNNIVSLGLPDLVGSEFHYTVLEDRTRVGGLRVADGPLPFNAHFDLNSFVANIGPGDAGPFTVSFYVSTDARITTSDVQIAQATIDALAGGSSAQIHFDGMQLPQHLTWTGSLYLGMIIDAVGTMPQVESSRDNNANEGDTIDRVIAQLYDPLPPVSVMASGFRTERQAALHLFRNGFLPQVPGTGRGWTKLLSNSLRFVSRRDGVRRPGLAYRQDAGIRFDSSTGTYFIEVQGSPTFGEPSPETAFLYGTAWFAYVRDWHRRF